ncbi:MAG TPA: hypothetical protein VF049_17855 [Nocardioidaceae bacterium]
MIKKFAAAALLLAAAPAVAGAAATQQPVTAATSTHTLHLKLHVTAGRDLDQQHFVGTERVRSRDTHKFIGFDAFSGQVKPGAVVFDTAFAFKGGILLTRVRTAGEAPTRYAGHVTSGSGVFAGATGTVRGRAVSRDDTFLTIRYSL